jgi:hypothetical protein
MALATVRPREGAASRAEGAGGKRDHNEKGAERGNLDDIAQGMNGDRVHLGLLDHD